MSCAPIDRNMKRERLAQDACKIGPFPDLALLVASQPGLEASNFRDGLARGVETGSSAVTGFSGASGAVKAPWGHKVAAGRPPRQMLDGPGRGRQLPATEKPAIAGPGGAPSFDGSTAFQRLSSLTCRWQVPASHVASESRSNL